MKTRNQLLEEGFKIDDTCYPNIAYKGDRFAPTEIHPVQTQREEELILQRFDDLGGSGIDLTFQQLRTDLVNAEMKLSKIKSILEDPNTDDYFALGQVLDVINGN